MTEDLEEAFSALSTDSALRNALGVTDFADTTEEPVTVVIPQGIATTLGVLGFFLSVLGTTGNVLTLVALWKNTKLRQQVASAFIASLVISDLSYCALNMPFLSIFLIYRNSLHEILTYPQASCKWMIFFTYINFGVSILSINLITVYRFIRIAYPHLTSIIFSRRNVILMIISTWFLMVILMVLPLTSTWGQIEFDSTTKFCNVAEDERGYNSRKWLQGFIIIIPCTIMVYCYSRIFWLLRKSRKNLKRHQVQTHQQRMASDPEQRVTRMILIIFFCFVICFAPPFITSTLDSEGTRWPVVTRILSIVPVWISAVINPLVYALSNPQYSEAYRHILCSCRQKRSVNAIGLFTGSQTTPS